MINDPGNVGDPHRELRELHEVYFARRDWEQPDMMSAEFPKYSGMLRKEARIRADQDEMLTRLTRRLAA